MIKQILLLSLVASAASASSISLSSPATGPSVVTTTGSLVANGSLVRVGTLTTAGDVSTFIEFGTSLVKNAGVGGTAKASKITGSVTNTNGEADDAQFNTRSVYIWVYNAATTSAATEQGLFKSSATFATDDPASASDTVTVNTVTFTEGVMIPGVGMGSFSATADNLTGAVNGGRFTLASAVPEPSSSLVGGFALLGLLARRRR